MVSLGRRCRQFGLLTDWSYVYSPQPEILSYLQTVARKYDLYSKTKFNTTVKCCVWDEVLKKWTVTSTALVAGDETTHAEQFDVM